MEAEPRAERGRRRRRADADAGEDDVRETVRRVSDLDPELRDWISSMLPGRALMRILRELPDDVVTHARAARRERLLAVRSLIDALIEDTERPRPRRAREIEIE
jgi:hypothetical protein